MPPKKTQISCPQCGQPIMAIVEQLFDVSTDPGAKQRLLGGISNHATCQICGFSGPLATPVIYHDCDKELLLTYFPPELRLTINEQEKLVGPSIKQITDKLPPEKRKAYLLQPQSFLTYQSLIERVLAADGITPEMIKEQQKRINLIEQLLGTSTPEARSELIKQEASAFDAEFFSIFGRLMESALNSSQEEIGRKMSELQNELLTNTEYGRKITSQYHETQEAINTLKSAGKSLDRDKLMNILIEAPNDDRLNALVGMTRPGLDYQFFQGLSEKINTKSGEERVKLEELRTRLLDITSKIDQHMEEEIIHAKSLLDLLLKEGDIEKATGDHLAEVNEIFIQILDQALQEAKKNKDKSLVSKLQLIVEVLQRASAPPAELALLEKLLEAKDDADMNSLLKEHTEEITPDFINILTSIIARYKQDNSDEKPETDELRMLEKVQKLYRAVLHITMKRNMG